MNRFFVLGAAVALLAHFSAIKVSAGETVRLYDFGADEMAYLSLPNQAPKASILLIPDSLGIPEVAASRCELLAKMGYIAMTVDFYNGQTAATLEQGRIIQGRVSAESARKTVAAALKMLKESPQYRTDAVIVAVWGANMEFVREVLSPADSKKSRVSIAGLCWLEPDGATGGDPFAGLPRPLKVVANNGPWIKELEAAQAGQPLKRIPADIRSYNGRPGFLLQSQSDETGAQAWVSIIEFWKTIVESTATVAPKEEPAVPEKPVSTTPAEMAPTKKSGILPKR